MHCPFLKIEMNKNKNETGYSLVELILTVILVSIAFTGLIGFFTGTMTDTVKNEKISQAILLAGQKMEEICSDRNEPTRGLEYITMPNQYPEESLNQFTRSVVIRSVVFSNVDAVEVIVSVTHPVIEGTYTLNHLFTDYNGY